MNSPDRRRLIGRLASLGGFAALGTTTGCHRWGLGSLEWTETVTLSSGEQIEIERDVAYSHPKYLGGGFGTARKWRKAILRSTAKPPLFPKWDAPLFAIYLDRDARGVWWLIGASDSASFWLRNAEPPTGQWAFCVKGDRWVLAPVPADYLGRKANLLVELHPDDTDWKIRREIAARKARPNPLYLHESFWTVLRERTEVYGKQYGPRIYRELSPYLGGHTMTAINPQLAVLSYLAYANSTANRL